MAFDPRSSPAPYASVGDFIIQDRLGSGAFAAVYRAEHRRTHELAAVKIFSRTTSSMSDRQRELLRREIKYWQQLQQHPNIVKVLGYSLQRDRACIVMELLPGGTVGDRLANHPNGKFSERSVQTIMASTISALAFCHANRIAHRDLKPDNLMLDGTGGVKVADFGLSTRQNEGGLIATMLVGSPNWMAPEVFHGNYDAFPADMWACGVIALQLLTGSLPFLASTTKKLLSRILACELDIPAYVSSSAADFVRSLITVDPTQRLTAVQALHHPFLAKLVRQQQQQQNQQQTAAPSSPTSSSSTTKQEATKPEEKTTPAVTKTTTTSTSTTSDTTGNSSGKSIPAQSLASSERPSDQSDRSSQILNGSDGPMPSTSSRTVSPSSNAVQSLHRQQLQRPLKRTESGIMLCLGRRGRREEQNYDEDELDEEDDPDSPSSPRLLTESALCGSSMSVRSQASFAAASNSSRSPQSSRSFMHNTTTPRKAPRGNPLLDSDPCSLPSSPTGSRPDSVASAPTSADDAVFGLVDSDNDDDEGRKTPKQKKDTHHKKSHHQLKKSPSSPTPTTEDDHKQPFPPPQQQQLDAFSLVWKLMGFDKEEEAAPHHVRLIAVPHDDESEKTSTAVATLVPPLFEEEETAVAVKRHLTSKLTGADEKRKEGKPEEEEEEEEDQQQSLQLAILPKKKNKGEDSSSFAISARLVTQFGPLAFTVSGRQISFGHSNSNEDHTAAKQKSKKEKTENSSTTSVLLLEIRKQRGSERALRQILSQL